MQSQIDPERFAALVDKRLHPLSGSVFYTGRAAFSRPSPLYILGLNPGGSPSRQAEETVGKDLQDWRTLPQLWSSYADESWEGRPAGSCGMQPRILHMLAGLNLDARKVPASNVVFVRSATEAALTERKELFLRLCWPVHEAVIRDLGVTTLLCLGGTAGRWAREALGADQLVDSWRETNARGWAGQAHTNVAGQCVVTVPHPSRADWRNPCADPTPLVQRTLAR
jgi:hypothetical protein